MTSLPLLWFKVTERAGGTLSKRTGVFSVRWRRHTVRDRANGHD